MFKWKSKQTSFSIYTYNPKLNIKKKLPKPNDREDNSAISNSSKIFLLPLFIWYTKKDAVNINPMLVSATANVVYWSTDIGLEYGTYFNKLRWK